MRLLLKVWLPMLAIAGVGASACLIAQWPALSLTNKLSFAVAITLVAHVYEEERFPGGFPYLFNVVVRTSDVPDRYPMSPLIAMLVDVGVFVVLFVPALIFRGIAWLAMGPMFLAFTEFLMHTSIGVYQWRRRLLPIYNPGLATACVFAAIAISFVTAATTNNMMIGRDWLDAVLYFVGTLLVCLVAPEFGLRSKTTRWVFDRNHFLGYYNRYTTLAEVFGDEATPFRDNRRKTVRKA